MEETVILTHASYEAVFLPSHGMNLVSFKRDGIEVIDQSTKQSFDERSAGLGALIGPHFHRRKPELMPKINYDVFPQNAFCVAKGITDPFSHGVARYVPWKYEKIADGVKATLSGKDVWQGITLAEIEGQNFQMTMESVLNNLGLNIQISVVSDSDSLVGLHYYYRLPNGKGTVKAQVRGDEHSLEYSLNHAIDQTFRPYPNPRSGHMTLETDEYTLKTEYDCISEENSWQLFHPEGASYVCIEPISAQDPHHPNLSVSSLSVRLRIDSHKNPLHS